MASFSHLSSGMRIDAVSLGKALYYHRLKQPTIFYAPSFCSCCYYYNGLTMVNNCLLLADRVVPDIKLKAFHDQVLAAVFFFVLDVCATQCSDRFSGSSPVVSMCFGGRATGRVIVLDAQTASKNDTECACFLTAKGSIVLIVNAAQEPGYTGCGSKIDVLFSSPRELYTFNCKANSYNRMDTGSTANLTLLKSSSASLWNYCLVLQVDSSDQSDSIEMVCSGPALGQTPLSTLETTVATVETMLTSSPLLSTTKTKEQLSTDYIMSTVSDNLTTEGIPETTLTNFTSRKLTTAVPTTRTLIVPSTTSAANMINLTSLHVDPFPSTEKETSPPPGISTTPNNVWTTAQETIVTLNVTSTKVLSSNQTQISARTTVSTSTMDSGNSSANIFNRTSPYINPFPSTEKEMASPPVLSTTTKTVLTTTNETILTDEVMTATTAISRNQTQANIQLTSQENSTPNGAALDTTKITSNTPQVLVTNLQTEATTDISLSRSTTSPLPESSSVTTSVIATPTRTSISSSSNITSSTMETTHTSVTTKTTTHAMITSLKPTVRTTEPALPSTSFSTTQRSTTVILAEKSTSTKPATSITQPVAQNTSSSSSPPTPSFSVSASSSSLSSSPSSSSSSPSSSTFTSISASLPSLSSSSEAATTHAATNNTTSPYTTKLSTHLPNTLMYTSSSLPPSLSSSSSSSQSTTSRESTTAFESRVNISEGITGRNVTTSTLERKEFELLPVVLPAALAGAIIIALFLFLTFTVVIKHRRTKSYHTGHNGEFHKAIYSETTRNTDGPSWPTGYDNLICSNNKELLSPINGVELVPIKNIYGEKPVNITEHAQTSSVSDNHL
ncbi:hypothetical protein ACJMK2_029618 [Sinanodonta woodiana]|uniref:Uncharacterized protein n=1 Tax=Sinanodonta woodiana TaxID=1069815 RepID=A0ABD3XAP1_SINWO